MTKKDTPHRAEIDYLRERVAYLEAANHWHHYAMDVLASMTSIFGDHRHNRDTQTILKCAHDCVIRVLTLEDAGYYIVDDDSNFNLAYRQPGCTDEELEAAVECLIDEGKFAWAINQNHPVCIHAGGRYPADTHLVMHVVSTRTRIRGMFVGRIRGTALRAAESGLKVLSIILFNTAYALESAALYALREQQHQTLRKITQRQSKELLHQHSHDTLTGLPNRVLFSDLLSQLMQRRGVPDGHIAVILMDLDHFKRVNDSLGHRAGDILIRRLAGEMRNTFLSAEVTRRYHLDVANVTLSRLGGDEFGIILDNVASLDLVARFVQQLIESISREHEVMDHQVFITCSAGISIHPFDGNDADTLIKNADAAMYEAKQRGRNLYQFYTKDLNSQTYRHLVLENQLVKALARDEFDIHYQPQVSLRTGKVEALEALVRWHHPEKGLLSPAHFIPIAEDTGIIEGLGLWVLKRVCEDMHRLREAGIEPPRMATNLSARQFRQAKLVERYAAILKEHDISPHRIELELTESTIMQDIHVAVDMFRQLHQLGFRLAVDDFGTGYSSLNNLKHFPIHSLKIDRSFVSDTPHDRDDTAIVTAIVAMAKGLGLEVVAEGVENEEQLAFLKQLDCEFIQGYYFSKPLPFNDLYDYLEAFSYS
ncbi:EAL domain-containing protein [Ectothiorhodospira sp. PHS-1]|uniref:putative bifunctional diguanylate cyclase/phosphodiesterase n=1 Tax=Ectothiorhodospira sp. PHS-1 TaxID=519989 RepID=UPI0006807320